MLRLIDCLDALSALISLWLRTEGRKHIEL